MPHHAIPPYDEDPDHMLIWLDITIGDPGEYIHLKDAFSSTAHPKHEMPVKLTDQDYTALLRSVGPTRVNFEGVWFLLAAFTDVERCIECFQENQDKHIFFIVSGSLGRTVVPIILERFTHIFTDLSTNEPYSSIYVYCHNIEYHTDWALDYRDYVQIFNHDADLLARMTRDIANFFVMMGKRLIEEDPPNHAGAYHRLVWAHELYQRYSKMENVSMKKALDEVNRLIDDVEDELKASSSDEDE